MLWHLHNFLTPDVTKNFFRLRHAQHIASFTLHLNIYIMCYISLGFISNGQDTRSLFLVVAISFVLQRVQIFLTLYRVRR